MKKIFCIALVLFAFTGVFAQEKTTAQVEFDAVYQNSVGKWKVKSHRMIWTTQSRVEGRPQTDYSSKTTTEFAPPDASRSTYENSFGSKNSKNETIRIGGVIYTRNNGEAWKEGSFEAKSQPESKSKSVDKQVDSQVEYKFLGSEKFNNQTANVYAKIAVTKTINPATNKETLSTVTTKYWFGEDGMILKSDMEMENRTGEMIHHSRVTQIWESDPNIKIEAPTLSQIK